MEVLEAINTRRSIGKVQPQEPPRELIERMLDAAVKAPNHHENQPWRFWVLTGKAREELGDVLAEALRKRMQGQDSAKLNALAESEKAKPLRAPVLIVVGVKHEENERLVPVEDLEASAAAIQNMLLAAHASGLAAQWRTGDGAYDPHVKAHFGLQPTDEIAGIVYVGYAADGFEPKPRVRPYAELTEWRTG